VVAILFSSYVLSLLWSVRFSFVWLNLHAHSLHSRVVAGRAAVDRYLLPAGPTAANPPHTAAAGKRDRQTPCHYIDPAPHTMWAVPITGVVDVLSVAAVDRNVLV